MRLWIYLNVSANSKYQTPKSKQVPITEFPISKTNTRGLYEFWSLVPDTLDINLYLVMKPVSALSDSEKAKLVLIIENQNIPKPVWQSENWFCLKVCKDLEKIAVCKEMS